MTAKCRKNYTPRKPLTIGEKYWRLTCINEAGVNKRNKKVYLFQCECGNQYKGLGTWVRMGRTKSCGCIHTEYLNSDQAKEQRLKGTNKLRLTPGESALNATFFVYKDRAKKYELEFSLTKEEFKTLTQRNCFYCNKLPSNNYGSKYNNGRYIYNGLDRIDNKLGYTLQNSVPCCKICNIAKHNLTLNDFLKHIKAIYFNLLGELND